MMRQLLLTCILLLSMIAPAAADYQVTGRFLYTDREFNLGGFTGNDPDRPIRLADVQVVDNATQQVLASGATDLNGDFSISVTDSQTRNVVVRALTSSALTSDLHITVRHRDNNGIYAISHPVFSSHSPTQDIDFSGSPVVAEPAPTSVGDAFNIFDVTLDGLDFVATQEGARPGASLALTLFWAVGNGNGTFYSHGSRSIFLVGVLGTDSDGYDDAVILHELGHYVEFNIGDSDNTGGAHAVNLCNDNNNLPLAWSEGWSTFFQNMVRDWLGLSGADTYVDTDGRSSGSGGAFLSYTVESFGFSVDMGTANEATINAVLWDIVDDNSTLDSSPGSDDDAFQLADGASRFWDVFTNYFPTTTTISMEDFFDGWLSRGHGMDTELRALLATWSMEFSDDAFEPDDNAGQARDAGVTGGTTHHTIFGAGDEDWTRFDGVQGSTYDFQTQNLPCGANTRLELRDSNGTTILASNDAPENNSDSINWVATQNGDLYLRVTRTGDGHAYANYDLVVGIVLPVTITDFSSESTADGLRLQWHGEAETGFSHFDIERADTIEGPFTQLNTDPIVADATDPTLYGYVDALVEPGRDYFYRIVGVEGSGERQAFGPYRATAAAPARLVLFPARPNPFNPNTVLSFDLPRDGAVYLRIYNIAGRHVRTLVGGETMAVGTRSVFWDGRDDLQRRVASGVYVVQLESLGDRQVQRVVLVR